MIEADCERETGDADSSFLDFLEREQRRGTEELDVGVGLGVGADMPVDMPFDASVGGVGVGDGGGGGGAGFSFGGGAQASGPTGAHREDSDRMDRWLSSAF